MRTQTRSRRRRIRLNRITFVQIPFVIQAFEQIPNGFDVFVFVSDVRIIEVNPITHFDGNIVPQILVPHNRFAAFVVIIVHRNLFADVFFRDTEFFFNREFNRQTMRIPTAFALDAFTIEGLKTAENILNRPRHNVVNAWQTIRRRWSFVKNKGVIRVALLNGFVEDPLSIPEV